MSASIPLYPNICFTGRMGSGKTEAARFLAEHLGYARLSLAEPLRAIADRLWPAYPHKRGTLVTLGKAIREINPDTLVNKAEQILDTAPYTTWAVDDARYINEFDALRGRGFVSVRLWAPTDVRTARLTASGKMDDPTQMDARIEKLLDLVQHDYFIENDGTLMDLYADVMAVIEKELRKS